MSQDKSLYYSSSCRVQHRSNTTKKRGQLLLWHFVYSTNTDSKREDNLQLLLRFWLCKLSRRVVGNKSQSTAVKKINYLSLSLRLDLVVDIGDGSRDFPFFLRK